MQSHLLCSHICENHRIRLGPFLGVNTHIIHVYSYILLTIHLSYCDLKLYIYFIYITCDFRGGGGGGGPDPLFPPSGSAQGYDTKLIFNMKMLESSWKMLDPL